MSEKLTVNDLREQFDSCCFRLNEIRSHASNYDADELFDAVAKEYSYMFSYIIDYLEQNQ